MEVHVKLLVLGGLFLLGLVADAVGRRTALPRVTLLILCGVVAGPSVFDAVPAGIKDLYEFLATAALTMVAFLLGAAFEIRRLRGHAGEMVVISIAVVVVTCLFVSAGLFFGGVELTLALVLAGIATATDPAATHDVVRSSGSSGPFSDTLLGIVALDDAWGMIAFSALLVIAGAFAGNGTSAVLWGAAFEIAAALAVGLAVGLPAAYLTGRLRSGEPMLMEALGVVFVCAGLAIWIGASFLIAGMVAGAIVANLARHHRRAFHEIEHIEWPFMLLFFFLAGASFDVNRIGDIGTIGIAYIVLRVLARIVGGWLGGRMAGAPALTSRWIGLALTPQAGVAIGMALVAGDHFPELRDRIITIAIGTTIVFETVGPLMTRMAVQRAGGVANDRVVRSHDGGGGGS